MNPLAALVKRIYEDAEKLSLSADLSPASRTRARIIIKNAEEIGTELGVSLGTPPAGPPSGSGDNP